jgi:hypothetical protein
MSLDPLSLRDCRKNLDIFSEKYFVPIPTMENNNTNKPKLFAALVKAIAETTDVHADATNPFHRNKYATLQAHLKTIKPIFAKHGLAIIQLPSSGYEKEVGVCTIIVHESGESIQHSIHVPAGENMTGQQAGALISYLRRYALAACAGIATEDDDAEADRVVRTATQASAPAPKFIPGPAAASTPTPTAVVSTGRADIDPSIVLPFGKNKGQAIGSVGIDDLKYWATSWEPRPFEKTGKVTAKDAKLKATAVALYELASSGSSEETQDEVPF